jgi:hypothetical protein
MDNDARARLLDSMRDAWCSNCDVSQTLIKREEELRETQMSLHQKNATIQRLKRELQHLEAEHLRTRGEP